MRQSGAGFCHLETKTCWGSLDGLLELDGRIKARLTNAPIGSYTRRLFDDSALLNAKLREEAAELGNASSTSEAVWEAADVLYFTLVKLNRLGGSLSDVEAELRRRSFKVSRRAGNAKEAMNNED